MRPATPRSPRLWRRLMTFPFRPEIPRPDPRVTLLVDTTKAPYHCGRGLYCSPSGLETRNLPVLSAVCRCPPLFLETCCYQHVP